MDYLFTNNNYLLNNLDYDRELLSKEIQCNDLISKEINRINNILLNNSNIKNIILEYADNYLSFLSYRILSFLNSNTKIKEQYNIYIMGKISKTKNLFNNKPNKITKYKFNKYNITKDNTLFIFYDSPIYVVNKRYLHFNKLNLQKYLYNYTDMLSNITNSEIKYIAENFYTDNYYEDYLYLHKDKKEKVIKPIKYSNIILHYIDFNNFHHDNNHNSYSAAIEYINTLDPTKNYIYYKQDDTYYTQKTNRLINYSIFALRKENNINIITDEQLNNLIDIYKDNNWKIHRGD